MDKDNLTISQKIKFEKDKFTFKVILIGDINVGKTNIIKRILGEDFSQTNATIGADFKYMNYQIKDEKQSLRNYNIQIQIWDTSGAEKFKAITLSHVRNSDGIFIVYDISNLESFKNIDFWIKEIEKCIDLNNIVIYLIGNKNDLYNMRKVSYDSAYEKAKKENFSKFVEVSAKENNNINNTFTDFYKEIFWKNKNKIIEKRNQNKMLFETYKENNEGCKCCS